MVDTAMAPEEAHPQNLRLCDLEWQKDPCRCDYMKDPDVGRWAWVSQVSQRRHKRLQKRETGGPESDEKRRGREQRLESERFRDAVLPAWRMGEGPTGRGTRGPLGAGKAGKRSLPWCLREEARLQVP